jgi:hypothetical protein
LHPTRALAIAVWVGSPFVDDIWRYVSSYRYYCSFGVVSHAVILSLLHPLSFAALSTTTLVHSSFGVRQIALSAEPAWAPPADAKWEEKNFEGEIQKLEQEASERMDAKIAEMMSKIDKTGL